MLISTWNILGQMSPWLLLGMVISGLLHVFLPAEFIRRRFKGTMGVIQAVAIGIPLPLCSCGVVPTGIGLKNQGADDGATVGFLISTPQTGIDSILVSVAFFGWPFAIFKMIAALVLGVIGGWISNLESVRDKSRLQLAADAHHYHDHGANLFSKFLLHCYDIFESIWLWLVTGVLVSAAIDAWVPVEWIQQLESMGTIGAMLIVLVISVPLYVCATASVPLAGALVDAGFPPSAALVFLMAGPATNTTTIGAIYSRFGYRVLATYLAVIVLGSMLTGWIFDFVLTTNAADVSDATNHHHFGAATNFCSVLVIALILLAFYRLLSKRLSKSRI